MNAFIVHQKERYLRPRVIVVSLTMLLAAPDGGIPSLILDYLLALLHELCCSRFPFLFLILRFFLIKTFPLCYKYVVVNWVEGNVGNFVPLVIHV